MSSSSCTGSCRYEVMSWNVGHESDYLAIQEYQKSVSTERIQEMSDDVLIAYRSQLIRNILMKALPDICCLQEVGRDEDRHQHLFDPANYCFICGDGEDTAVVYNATVFSLHHSFKTNTKKALYTIVDLKDRQTAAIIRVVSAHLSSCEDPIEPCYGDAAAGDEQLDFIMCEMKSDEDKLDAIVIGLDANTVPSYYNRVAKLALVGFKTDPYHRGTCLRTKLLKQSERRYETFKSDSICAFGFRNALNIERLNNEREMTLELGNLIKNPSDHSPVQAAIILDLYSPRL